MFIRTFPSKEKCSIIQHLCIRLAWHSDCLNVSRPSVNTNDNKRLQMTVSMMLFSLIVIVPLIPTLAYVIHKAG